jgi:hypothetical protein
LTIISSAQEATIKTIVLLEKFSFRAFRTGKVRIVSPMCPNFSKRMVLGFLFFIGFLLNFFQINNGKQIIEKNKKRPI